MAVLMLDLLGPALAILGSILACYGVWVFNVRGDPRTANLVCGALAIRCYAHGLLDSSRIGGTAGLCQSVCLQRCMATTLRRVGGGGGNGNKEEDNTIQP